MLLTETSSIWTAIALAAILTIITLIFSIYQYQRGALPGQHEGLQMLKVKVADQDRLIALLQDQGAQQWARISAQAVLLAELRAENAYLKKSNDEQRALISALERKLTGLATDNRHNAAHLRQVLTDKLNQTELKEWASDLRVPFESLAGSDKSTLVMSMLEYLERYGKLEEGIAELKRKRPDITLTDEV